MSFITCNCSSGGGGSSSAQCDPGGRLTLTSGLPVTIADVSNATTVYYCPYLTNQIGLWNGTAWVSTTFVETALALGAVTSGANYDVFGYLSAGALALEKLVWTDNTTRATDITLQDGRYCKNGDKTKLYLGTFRTTSVTATEDSGGGTVTQVGGKRFLWNAYNRVRRAASVIDTTNFWVYTSATVRQANAASGNQVEYVCGLAIDTINVAVCASVFLLTNAATGAVVGVGIDVTNAFSGERQTGYNTNGGGVSVAVGGAYQGLPGQGYHYLAWLEAGAGGADCEFIGDSGTTTTQSGLTAEVWA